MGLLSCSNGSSVNLNPIPPIIPDITTAESAPTQSAGHVLWGYYLVRINEKDYSAEIIPVRATSNHWNIIQFLEQAPCTDCFKLAGITPNPDGTLNVNVSIKHPFSNPNLTGFDVRGIAMFNGSHVFPESGLIMSDRTLGEGEVVNAGGYTTLYNPSTIGHGFEGYIKGNLATVTAPSSTLNAFKRFITNDPANTRNAFYAGDEIVVTYQIDMPDPPNPWVFGYAVDTSWAPPISKPVDDPMSDFGPEANCTEPWKIVVMEQPIDAGLTYKGGETKLTIDVYDWQGKTTHHDPVVECPELFDGSLTASWVSDGPEFTRYEITISNSKLASFGNYACLVGVEANENDPVGKPWLDLTAYQLMNLEVSGDGKLIWAKRAGGAAYDHGYAITTLSDNSTVVTGYFEESATFGPGEPNMTVLTPVGIYPDIFIARYNPDGTLAWAKRAGGNRSDCGLGITALSDDSTVVTGHFMWPATFGPGEPNQTVLTSVGGYDIFIARYNTDGTLAWAKRAGGTWEDGYDEGNGITTLSDNSTVVTGCFTGWANFGPGEPNQTVLVSPGDADIDTFIARYNPDGTLAWAKRAGEWGTDIGSGITTLSDNSTVVTGWFNGLATFGPGEPNQTVLTSAGYGDIFIARYNPDGALAWAKRAGGASDDNGNGITALSDNSTVVTGYFSWSAIFGPGEPNETVLTTAYYSEVFIARYNPDGTLAWAKRAGGASDGFFEPDVGTGITTLSDNSTVVTGYFFGSATFGLGESNETVLTSAGGRDIFIARYNPYGTLAWAKRAGGAPGDYFSDQGSSITVLSDNSTVLTGHFGGSATFGPGEPNETVLTSAGDYDIFIARFAP